jgi:glycerol-3-phosphate O-acyltransferase
MLAHNGCAIPTYSQNIYGLSACKKRNGYSYRLKNTFQKCTSNSLSTVDFEANETKVKLAKLLVDVLPGEIGLRILVRIFPNKIQDVFGGLLDSYKSQLCIALKDEKKASEAVTFIFKDMLKAYIEQFLGTPYEFPSYHKAIREPYDYYQMANMYIGSLIDFDRSILMYPERWTLIQDQINAGENVILFANHQSEGDAAFIPLLTEVSHPGLGEKVTYVAGDRVITDLLAKPFSMGKNLLCVNSKKHMNDIPELKAAKMKQNLTTIKEMQKKLQEGGFLIWIAPAGGRDRRNADGTLIPDRFDPQAVEMMKKLGSKKSAAKTHFYPLAMATYDIMPPPLKSEKDIGEKRIVNYTGVGLSLGHEIDVSNSGEWAANVAEDADLSYVLSEYVWNLVNQEYNKISNYCNPKTDAIALNEDGIRPIRPKSVPDFV